MTPIPLTPWVKRLLIVLVVLFVLDLVALKLVGQSLSLFFGVLPSVPWQFWRLATYPFFHAELMHLVFNALVFYMIGSELEALWGPKIFLSFTALTALSGGVVYLVLALLGVGTGALMIGSSGAIYGLLTAYGILFAERTMLFMMLFPIKAKYFVLLLGAIEFISTIFYSNSAAASACHLGGMITGFAYLLYLARVRQRGGGGKGTTRRKANHLKMVHNADRSNTDSNKRNTGPTFH